MKSCSTSTKLERKAIEKNRRIHMKSLCFKLASLIPSHYPKEGLSQQDQVDLAAAYIQKLQAKIEGLKEKRDLAMSIDGINKYMRGGMMIGVGSPIIEVRDLGSTLEVVLISGLDRKFTTCDVISVLEEEGVDVVSANFSFTADKVIYIIHSQVTNSRVGFESGRVYQKLKDLVH
ncbi:transcription factor bHLH162-like [Magnolia sinica]|uniref:transcription factor bHLH162-like n=1 Tax=Magnolia sinica TaxID=86752 RepID=UPI002658B26B|nr:transcription factor bHLH162-like [Magnolia sinica]